MLAGEDSNDRKSLRILLEEFCPQMRGRLVEINDKVRLRDATQGTLSARVDVLAKKARARASRENAELACVFVHEDLDRIDGEMYITVRDRVQKALIDALGSAHYVLSVEEMEAWLLLFPDALAGMVSSWKVPAQYRNRDTGSIADPKKVLMRSVSKSGRPYRESDAPAVFGKAVALGCVHKPVGTNRSWNQLRTDASDCCQQHIPRMRRSS
ncbi:hypothetical protein ABZ814_21710 [Micromonospora musae]|uniref:hypothetical protein n=1 Tax=Micromonospora musae TaxID=1894970 RepID=UPI0033ED71BD